ncbi:MAG: hypothetical protein J6Z01_05565 [Bacteroidales bacterium]|nr:hypothetical protein [Bacteroidales bacterium]
MENQTVKDRVKYFCDSKKISIKQFEELCGLSNGYISSMRKGFGAPKLKNVLKQFPDLNREWLLFGDGEMLKKTEIHNTISNTGAFSTNTINGDLGTQLSELISEQKELRKDFMSLMNEKNKQINDLIEIVKKNNSGI